MKKWMVLLLLAQTILLSSCRVNWFSESYDVPWWAVVVPLVLIIVIAHFSIVARTYRCPECGERIRPKWYEITAWVHSERGRVMKCPKCGRMGFCSPDKR